MNQWCALCLSLRLNLIPSSVFVRRYFRLIAHCIVFWGWPIFICQHLMVLTTGNIFQCIFNSEIFKFLYEKKSLPAWRAHSHRALRASLIYLGAHWARDSTVAIRASFSLNLVLCARSYILRIYSSLFLVIWYWNSSQFYYIINVD